MFIYIYIYRERERERHGKLDYKHINVTRDKGDYLVILVISESIHQKLIILNIYALSNRALKVKPNVT